MSPSFSRVFHNIFIVSITLIIHHSTLQQSLNNTPNAESSVIFCAIFLLKNTGCQAMA